MVTRLTISGGGAKGTVLSGAYRAIRDLGVFRNLEQLSGTSAGALTASLMSLGVSPREIHETLSNISIQDFLGQRTGRLFYWKNKLGITMFTHEGRPLYDFLVKKHQEGANEALNQVVGLERAINENSALQLVVAKIRSGKEPILFKDLSVLHQNFPEQFKDLTVTAVRVPSGQVQIFNAKTTPDVEIAKASWASAAIPALFEPVTININNESHQFVDGGVYENLPTEYFDYDGKNFSNQKPEQTIVWAYGDGPDIKKNKLFQALYGASPVDLETGEFLPIKYYVHKLEGLIHNFLAWVVLGFERYNYHEESEKILNKIREKYMLRTTLLRTSVVGSGDFYIAQRAARTLDALGYMDQFQFHINHDLHSLTDDEVSDFYSQLVVHFTHILNALNKGADKELETCRLSQEIAAVRDRLTESYGNYYHSLEPEKQKTVAKLEDVINKELCSQIVSTVEKHLSSKAAFAFTRAIDYMTKQIDENTLFREVYLEAFERSSGYKASSITGQHVFDTHALKKALDAHKNFFLLYFNQIKNGQKNKMRASKIAEELLHIDGFKHAFIQEEIKYDTGVFKENLPKEENNYNVKLTLLMFSKVAKALSVAALTVFALSAFAVISATVGLSAAGVGLSAALLSYGLYRLANHVHVPNPEDSRDAEITEMTETQNCQYAPMN